MATNIPTLQGSAVGQIPVQRKSWLGRNWKWLLLAIFLVMVCFGLGIFALIMSWMRGSDVAQEALARAQANPAVVQRLGARIEEGWMMSGSINVSGGTGDANLAVPISGPKGSAKVYVTAQKIAGAWNYSQMIVAIETSGEKIDLLSSPAESQSTTPNPALASPQNQAAPNSAASAVPPAQQQSGPTPSLLSAASSGVIQSQDTNIPGVTGELIQCRRSDGVLSIKIRFHNTSAAPVSFYVLAPNTSYDKFYLSAASKKYFILKDADGTYLAPGSDFSCGMPGVCEKLDPGKSNTWWAKFPAPSADVTKVDLYTPVTPPFEDVLIADN
jgi:hypothetical protein